MTYVGGENNDGRLLIGFAPRGQEPKNKGAAELAHLLCPSSVPSSVLAIRKLRHHGSCKASRTPDGLGHEPPCFVYDQTVYLFHV